MCTLLRVSSRGLPEGLRQNRPQCAHWGRNRRAPLPLLRRKRHQCAHWPRVRRSPVAGRERTAGSVRRAARESLVVCVSRDRRRPNVHIAADVLAPACTLPPIPSRAPRPPRRNGTQCAYWPRIRRAPTARAARARATSGPASSRSTCTCNREPSQPVERVHVQLRFFACVHVHGTQKGAFLAPCTCKYEPSRAARRVHVQLRRGPGRAARVRATTTRSGPRGGRQAPTRGKKGGRDPMAPTAPESSLSPDNGDRPLCLAPLSGRVVAAPSRGR